jgi:hypothetical protein
MTTSEEFKQLSNGGNVIPVYETLLADTETPVSIYLKIYGQGWEEESSKQGRLFMARRQRYFLKERECFPMLPRLSLLPGTIP